MLPLGNRRGLGRLERCRVGEAGRFRPNWMDSRVLPQEWPLSIIKKLLLGLSREVMLLLRFLRMLLNHQYSLLLIEVL